MTHTHTHTHTHTPPPNTHTLFSPPTESPLNLHRNQTLAAGKTITKNSQHLKGNRGKKAHSTFSVLSKRSKRTKVWPQTNTPNGIERGHVEYFNWARHRDDHSQPCPKQMASHTLLSCPHLLSCCRRLVTQVQVDGVHNTPLSPCLESFPSSARGRSQWVTAYWA